MSARALFIAAAAQYRPLSALFELTHRCHLACKHCYLDDNHHWHDKARELTTAEAADAITQLRAAGNMFLTISGGETFVRPDLFALLRHARELGLAVTLFTTGTLLREKHLPELARLYLRGVELSLYSDQAEIHDAITQQPGSHAKTMRATKLLIAHSIPVTLKCPLMQPNAASYPGLKQLAKQLGVALTVDATLTATNAGKRAPLDLRLTEAQLVAFHSQPELRRTLNKTPDKDAAICGIGKRSCVIGPFGDVYTCLGYQRSLGNLREQRFNDIWSDTGALYTLRRLRVRDLPVCGSCEKSSYCGRCAGSALLEEGDFNAPSRWACQQAAAQERASGTEPQPSAAQRMGRYTRRNLPIVR